jgi:hypothetical protein
MKVVLGNCPFFTIESKGVVTWDEMAKSRIEKSKIFRTCLPTGFRCHRVGNKKSNGRVPLLFEEFERWS